MNIEKYQELTGITVDSEDIAKITAQIRRTKGFLENMLGYSLDKKKAGINQYEEKGKATVDCIFRDSNFDLDTLDLSAPDQVIGSYRLFNYNKADKFFEVDPFTKLHKVKLVFVKSGDEPNGITHKTFDDGRVRVHREGRITKAIERCKECFCSCYCDSCVQLAVDADWLNEDCLPDDLLYIWADMVTFYTDDKKDLKSETLATHSYTKNTLTKPEELSESVAIIKKYAGPNGSVNQTITV